MSPQFFTVMILLLLPLLLIFNVYKKFVVFQGMCGENTASMKGISREQQDEYAISSYTRSANAWKVKHSYFITYTDSNDFFH